MCGIIEIHFTKRFALLYIISTMVDIIKFLWKGFTLYQFTSFNRFSQVLILNFLK